MKFNSYTEASTAYRQDVAMHAELGIVNPFAQSYLPEEFRRNYALAMDAQPQLLTDPNSALPAMLTSMIDPVIYEILFAPLKAAEILGEQKKGDWLLETAFFGIAEPVGEVSSYGDYSANGHANVNVAWPQRQAYLFQVIKQYGDREAERAGLARLNWVAEIDKAAAVVLNRFMNLTYFFGITNLQNYGLLNDPSLSASLTPATKAWGGTTWISNGVVKASANEIFNDIQAVFIQLVQQTRGLIDRETPMILALSPMAEAALTQTNSFNVNVSDLLKKNFPNLKVITAVQYEATSASNPQGLAGGNFMQLIATSIEGQQTGYAAFNEKYRAHPIVRDISSTKQKVTAGTWGSVIRAPFGVASMIGI